MKKFYNLMGSALLGIAALLVVVGPASLNLAAVEEMPAAMKNSR